MPHRLLPHVLQENIGVRIQYIMEIQVVVTHVQQEHIVQEEHHHVLAVQAEKQVTQELHLAMQHVKENHLVDVKHIVHGQHNIMKQNHTRVAVHSLYIVVILDGQVALKKDVLIPHVQHVSIVVQDKQENVLNINVVKEGK